MPEQGRPTPNPLVDQFRSRLRRSMLSPLREQDVYRYMESAMTFVKDFGKLGDNQVNTYLLAEVMDEEPLIEPYAFMSFYPVLNPLMLQRPGNTRPHLHKLAFFKDPVRTPLRPEEMNTMAFARRVLDVKVPERILRSPYISQDDLALYNDIEIAFAVHKAPSVLLTLNNNVLHPDDAEPVAALYTAPGISPQSALALSKGYASEMLAKGTN